MGEHPRSKKPNQKRHQKVEPLTPEQLAAAKAAQELAAAERKAEEERLKIYEKQVPSMSHAQLHSELRKQVRSRFVGKPAVLVGGEGLNVAEALVSLLVLEGTKTTPGTYRNSKGELRATRMDQINQLGRLSAYPR